MEHSLIAMVVTGFVLLVAGTALDHVRREFARKRNDYRMGQALRRGLSQPGGPWSAAPQVVEWQSCESTSANWF